MKKKNKIFLLILSILIFTLYSCVGTAPVANETNLQDDSSSNGGAEQRSLPAPPGFRRWSQTDRNNIVKEGIVINGVEWAPYNVDRDGSFVKNPEDSGWTYQWNSARAEFSMMQSTAGLLPVSFFTNYPRGNTWEKEKDPSPEGWRVPTLDEVKSLFDTSKVINEWTIINGVTGRRFTDRSSGESIFIPASGKWFADIDAGERTLRKMDIGTGGYYWTASAQGDFGAETFEFNSGGVSLKTNHRVLAFMIRPVKTPTTHHTQ